MDEKMQQTNKLAGIMTDMVMSQVVDDKITAAAVGAASNASSHHQPQEDTHADNAEDEAGDDSLSRWREKRMAQLKSAKIEEAQQSWCNGSYDEIGQDEFLPVVTKNKLVVCHFYEDGFERCRIVDKHLQILAPLHTLTKFIKLNATKSSFFVRKLSIRTLPAVVLFVDGVAVHSVVGFAEFGGSDSFSSRTVEGVLKKHKVITQLKVPKSSAGGDISSDDD
eukprot:GHVS01049014.1.p1 GENE.GHVS01049014.1~~GHVS01049014.1.p1  ORF type:complete len:222 (+),score=41.60 GHVS01049014.1:215-880(+)